MIVPNSIGEMNGPLMTIAIQMPSHTLLSRLWTQNPSLTDRLWLSLTKDICKAISSYYNPSGSAKPLEHPSEDLNTVGFGDGACYRSKDIDKHRD